MEVPTLVRKVPEVLRKLFLIYIDSHFVVGLRSTFGTFLTKVGTLKLEPPSWNPKVGTSESHITSLLGSGYFHNMLILICHHMNRTNGAF
jgi:hypothetical protein